MKNESTLVVLLRLFGILIVSWLIWVLVFTLFTPDEQEMMVQPFQGADFVFAFITSLFVSGVLGYNRLARQKQQLRAQRSNITIAEKRGNDLLSKADQVVAQYQKHERTTYTSVAESSGNEVPVKSAFEFQQMIQTFPELQANASVMTLLKQIRETEYATGNHKLEYNQAVMDYNTALHSLPGNILRKLLKIEDEDFYQESVPEITVELLEID